ncbi:hypothetical protein V3C99_010695 [Haemonchus contortus]
MIPFFSCNIMLDTIGFLLFGLVIYGMHSSPKTSPVLVLLSTVFCTATSLQLVQDFGLNILILNYILYHPNYQESDWQDRLSLTLTGLIISVQFFLTLLQALMAFNRLCAVLLLTRYPIIFNLRNTAIAIAIIFIVTIPPLPILLLRVGDCYVTYYPTSFAFYYHGSHCRIIMGNVLFLFCIIMLSGILTIDCTVFYVQYKRKSNSTLNRSSFLTDLQFCITTVALASLSGFSIMLSTALDFVESKMSANYFSKLVNIFTTYIYFIAIGLINRRVRRRILDTICFWKATKVSSVKVTARPPPTSTATI